MDNDLELYLSYNFVRWALAFGKMLGIDLPPKTFGL